MNDVEIENLLTELINSFGSSISSDKRTLVFRAPNNNIDLHAFWNTHGALWDCDQDIDPLSLFLITKKPEREKTKHDDEVVATLSSFFERRSGWIYSFQYGWYGLSNNSTSITGYLVGHKLRFKFLNKF